METYVSEKRLAANELFKAGKHAEAAVLYLQACHAALVQPAKSLSHSCQEGNEEESASSQALTIAEIVAFLKGTPSLTSTSKSSGGVSSSESVPPLLSGPQAAATPVSVSYKRPGTLSVGLLDEVSKCIGNFCTCTYKLRDYDACCTVATAIGIRYNPYLAKAHAFAAMSTIQLSSIHTCYASGRAIMDTSEEVDRAVIEDEARLSGAIQQLFLSMFLLPSLAAQVSDVLRDAIHSLQRYQATLGRSSSATTHRSSNSIVDHLLSQATPLTSSKLVVKKHGDSRGSGVFASEFIAPLEKIMPLGKPFSVSPYEGCERALCIGCGASIAEDAQIQDAAEGDDNERNSGAAKSSAAVGLGCDACRMVAYCSSRCYDAYHVSRHLLHECAFFFKLRYIQKKIVESEGQIDVPDEFMDLAGHVITTISGLLSLKGATCNKGLLEQPAAANLLLTAAEAEARLQQAETSNYKSSSLESWSDNKQDTASPKGTTHTARSRVALPSAKVVEGRAALVRQSVLNLESHAAEVAQSMHPTLPILCEVFSTSTGNDGRPADTGALRSLIAAPTVAAGDLPAIDEALIAHVLGIVRCNSMELADPTGLGIGQGLFAVPEFKASAAATEQKEQDEQQASQAAAPTACLINHSCAPNAFFDTVRREVRAVRSIPQGEAIAISYIPQLYWPGELRREGLSERFYFSCKCERCVAVDGAGTGTDMRVAYDRVSRAERPQHRPGATAYHHRVAQGICGGIRQRAIDDIQSATSGNASGGGGSSAPKNEYCDEVEGLMRQCLTDLEPWSYVLQDVRNTLTFLYSVIGAPAHALVASLEELLLLESSVTGALPAKVSKLRNILAAMALLPPSASVTTTSSINGTSSSGSPAGAVDGAAAALNSPYRCVLESLLNNIVPALCLLYGVEEEAR